jgi:hypothetical protein
MRATLVERKSMIFHRRFKFFAALALCAAPSALLANDDICTDIQRRLTGGSLMIGNSSETRIATHAINDQNAYIRQIRTDMRRNGCSIGSVIVYGNRNAELCGELGDRLIEARSELDFLNAQRQQLKLTRQTNLPIEERRALEDAWDNYGCVSQASRSTQDFDQLPPPNLSPQPPRGAINPPVTIIDPSNRPSTQGTLRTMCVRTCDGKFFPISSQASPIDFSTHAQQCQNACPAAATELFYHALVGQESKDMVSASNGQSYTALPNAYRFQSEKTAGDNRCSCGAQGSIEFGEKPEVSLAAPKPDLTPKQNDADTPPAEKITPQSRPANSSQPIEPVNEARPYVPGDRKIRAVGPQFFPQDSAIDLTKPATGGAQPQQ